MTTFCGKKRMHCDASFDEENHTAILGFALYNENDEIIYKASIGQHGVLNSFHAELLGIQAALDYLKEQGCYQTILITDHRGIVTKINEGGKIKGKPEYRDWYNGQLNIIKQLKNQLHCELRWVSRKKNKSADALTKKN